LELIRTIRKEKLPKGFSYPVGAEAISTVLVDVPQFRELAIYFSWKDTFWASKYNAKIRAAGKVTIVDVHFWREWRMSVHAIPSEHSASARAQLSGLLNSLATQLIASPIEPAHFRWEASYDLARSVLATGS
jgi:hypothetical protein